MNTSSSSETPGLIPPLAAPPAPPPAPPPEAQPGPKVVETHISTLFFVDDLVLKRRKPVTTGFLDFASVEARRLDCEREVELNRRLAPDVYLGVASFDLPGAFTEPLVVMRRLPVERRLSALLAEPDAGEHVREVARIVASFHTRADRGERIDAAATIDAVQALWSAGFEQLSALPGELVERAELDRAARLAHDYLAGRRPLFDQRLASGRAVDGHGDLLAEDIFCLEDGPRILDCLEFDEHLRFGDALLDLAFLAMDLERLGAVDLVPVLLDSYREFSSDAWPDSLMHHFIAYRAHVRMKVAWIRYTQGDPTAADQVRALHQLCVDHLERGRVRMVIVGGSPGTGKTTVAKQLADGLAISVISSDDVRDELMPRAELATRTESARHDDLHAGRYAPERTGAVYAELLRRAAVLLEHGESVVLDASWLDAGRRAEAREMAALHHVPLCELRCDCPIEVAAERVGRRLLAGSDASEATPAVARLLAADPDPWPEATVLHTAEASTSAEVT